MTVDPRIRSATDLRATTLFDLVVALAPNLSFGTGPVGHRVLFGATGGAFEGTGLRGTVVPGGGDWALFRPGGTMSVDVRLTLRTDDDALIHMTYGGRLAMPPELRADLADPGRRHAIDPSRYYFRTNPLFETGDDRYAWLNDIVCIGSGCLVEGGVAYTVFRIG